MKKAAPRWDGLIGLMGLCNVANILKEFFRMKRIALISLIALAACQETTGTVITPSGAEAHIAKCKSSANSCMAEASKKCSGPYQVIDSHSNAGGILADIMPGPVTWYSMTYQCGRSDGKMPQFPFRGSEYQAPAVVQAPAYRAPTMTSCSQLGNTVQCNSF